MAEITDASNNERIFYLPDFIYFVQTTPFHHPGAVNVFVRRILEILVLFDRILIPAEHLNINAVRRNSEAYCAECQASAMAAQYGYRLLRPTALL